MSSVLRVRRRVRFCLRLCLHQIRKKPGYCICVLFYSPPPCLYYYFMVHYHTPPPLTLTPRHPSFSLPLTPSAPPLTILPPCTRKIVSAKLQGSRKMASMGPASASSPSPNINDINVTNNHVNANATSNPRHSTAFVSFSSLRSSARRITNSLSPVKQTEPHVFSGKESPPRFSTDRSSTSSRSSHSQQPLLRTRAASSSTASLPYFADQNTTSQKPTRHHPSASATLPTQSPPRGLHRVDAILPSLSRAATSSSIPHASAHQPASSVAMMSIPFGSSFRPENSKPPSIPQPTSGFGPVGSSAPLPGAGLSAGYAFAPPGNVQNPSAVYQHIHDISAKRISTLAYLKKA